jgi:hypothetical protein
MDSPNRLMWISVYQKMSSPVTFGYAGGVVLTRAERTERTVELLAWGKILALGVDTLVVVEVVLVADGVGQSGVTCIQRVQVVTNA